MTVSRTHEVSVLSLPDILRGLKVEAEDFSVVFVVPESVLPYFKFPGNMVISAGSVRMFVTIPKAVSEAAFMEYFMTKE